MLFPDQLPRCSVSLQIRRRLLHGTSEAQCWDSFPVARLWDVPQVVPDNDHNQEWLIVFQQGTFCDTYPFRVSCPDSTECVEECVCYRLKLLFSNAQTMVIDGIEQRRFIIFTPVWHRCWHWCALFFSSEYRRMHSSLLNIWKQRLDCNTTSMCQPPDERDIIFWL